jgi:peptidoglycan/xylan/chitin deacetylase (PgdA/CDA1 family)
MNAIRGDFYGLWGSDVAQAYKCGAAFMLTSKRRIILLAATLLLGSLSAAGAANCPGNPNAIGTTRVLKVKPSDFPLVGRQQYMETLRLRDREVVLTFDDGPMPPYTNRILDILAAECVKATFFVLGVNVAEAPDLVRRAAEEGHSIGTHTFSHAELDKLPIDKAKKEIDLGLAVASEALGGPSAVTPFFRAPMLSINKALERHLHLRGLMVWSIDVDSNDWMPMGEEKLVEGTIAALEKAGKGIVLLHDIQPVTARALPALLAELKRRNFNIVHVVPSERAYPMLSSTY